MQRIRGKRKISSAPVMGRRELVAVGVALVASLLSGVLATFHANAVVEFVVSAVALATLAALVGEATEQIGFRLGTGATGVLQSTLGNLPELFASIFALRAGLIGLYGIIAAAFWWG